MILSFLNGSTHTTCATTMSEAPSRASEVAARWSALPGSVVDSGEIVLLAIKPSVWRPVFDSAEWLVTSCLLAAALLLLGTPLPGMSLTGTAQAVLLVGLARLGFAVVRWVPTWYVLTNRRVLDVRGVRAPRVWACPLIEVRNTYVNATFAERLTRHGTISFVTDHPDEAPRIWQGVPQPDLVHAKIRRAIEQSIDQHSMGV